MIFFKKNQRKTTTTESNAWVQKHATGDAPTARYAHAAVGVGTKLYVYGGTDGSKYFDEFYMLDTGTKDFCFLKNCFVLKIKL